MKPKRALFCGAPMRKMAAMELNRINPVALVTGAHSQVGAAAARTIASRASGGLILADPSEQALAELADQLETRNLAPERVSTLAFDTTAPERWAQAASFITSQYGRLDWAVLNVAAETPTEGDLMQWPAATPAELEAAIVGLKALTPLLRANTQGGSVVITASGTSLARSGGGRPHLVQLMRAAAHERGLDRIRVNALAPGSAETPGWDALPWFQDLVVQAGGERGAFEMLSKLDPTLARYASPADVGRLLIMLLSDQSPISGATLVVDGGYRL